MIPDRMMALRVFKGIPVPWFVEWYEEGKAVPYGTGTPDFRFVDPHKRHRADGNTCWICGQALGLPKAFVVSVADSERKIAREPPSHRECAEYALKVCPFINHKIERNVIGQSPPDYVIYLTEKIEIRQSGHRRLWKLGAALEVIKKEYKQTAAIGV